MSLSMYQVSVPVFTRSLNNLSSILKKAEAHADTKKIDPAVLVNARLYPDMFPLTRQIQLASDAAKGCAARLAGQEPPSFSDDEQTLPELRARLDKTAAFLQTLKATQVDGSEDRAIELKMRDRTLHLKGQDYLLGFSLPNFFFHITTAYAILRHNGVEIGKKDFLGPNP